jgi:hypothetical protein
MINGLEEQFGHTCTAVIPERVGAGIYTCTGSPHGIDLSITSKGGRPYFLVITQDMDEMYIIEDQQLHVQRLAQYYAGEAAESWIAGNFPKNKGAGNYITLDTSFGQIIISASWDGHNNAISYMLMNRSLGE